MTPFQVFRGPQVRASAAVLPCVVLRYTGENQAATATAKATASHRPIGVSAEWTKYPPTPAFISNVNHADSGDPITYYTAGSVAQVRVGSSALSSADTELTFDGSGYAIAAVSGDWVFGRNNHVAAANAKVEVRLEQPYIKA